MSIHFVSTSILSSTDGINHDKEEEVESNEVIKARKEAERAANKPLYQQLAGIYTSFHYYLSIYLSIYFDISFLSFFIHSIDPSNYSYDMIV